MAATRLVRRRWRLSTVALLVVVAAAVAWDGDRAPAHRLPPADRQPPTATAIEEIPAGMLVRYRSAARTECPGLPWAVLAGIGRVETDHHRNKATSSAGAQGPMQFMPATWAAFGVDADGDGAATITDPDDAVAAAARYLCASDATDPTELRQAIWNYNHADWYVDRVLEAAARYGPLPADIPARR